MAKRGRKPLPAHELKQFVPERHSHHLPQPTGEPTRPTTLNATGLAMWDEVVPLLVELKIATDLDQSQLVAMCEMWAHYRHWADQEPDLRTVGAMTKCYANFMAVAAKFGLTPSDRRKLRPKPPKVEVSPFAEFLNRKKGLTG